MSLLIGELLADAASVNPQAIAATLGAESVTYRQLDRTANRMANALSGHGVEPGQTVCWWSGPSLSTIAGFAAVARLGGVFAPLNPACSESEGRAFLEYLHPRMIVADGGHMDMANDLAGGSASIRAMDTLDAGGSAAEPDSDDGPSSDSSPHIIYLTSGTTGRPKGVVVSHRASWLRSFPGGSTFATGLHGDGGILASFPLFHYGGWHYVLEAWHHRTATHICSGYDGESLMATAERWRPTALYCIPAIWNRVLDAYGGGPALQSVRHADTGTSAAPQELLARIRAAMPAARTSVLYGSSEGGHHTTLHDWDIDRKPGSVGRVAPPGVISLTEDNEILYRGPTLMEGYFERPAETAAALDGGWYHTGDLGIRDDEGYIYVTGRVREVIRTGGESVAPIEVEAALVGLPGVVDVAVVGLPDDQWGEIVCAAVVTDGTGPAPGTSDLRAHVEGRLAAFKHPRRVIAVRAIPRTATTGQVQRTLLREELQRDSSTTKL